MKLLLVFLLISFGTQCVLSKPGWWGDFVSSVKDSVAKTIDKAKDLYKKALKEYPFLEDALNELKKELLKSGKNIESIIETAQKFIVSIEKQIQDLLKLVTEKLEFISTKIAEALLKEASGLRKWANSTLKTFKDSEKLEKAKKIVKNFMEKSFEKINKCAKAVRKPIHELYKFTNNTAMEGTTLAKKVVETLGLCSKEENLKNCGDIILNIIKDGTDLIITKVTPIKTILKEIGKNTTISLSGCLATSKIAIEIHKASVASRLKALNKDKF